MGNENDKKLISEIIRERIYNNSENQDYYCNHNISQYINDGELELIIEEVTEKFQSVLESLVIDTDNDHNTSGTAYRVAKMFVNEVFYGRYHPAPKITDFPNVTNYNNLYITGPITIRSTCAHHFQPIVGKAWIGIVPGENVIGLSKFNRIIDWVASRPQIQEEMSEQVANEIEKITKAKGIAVIIRAEHMCLTHRGVREHESDMTTSVMRGAFMNDIALRQEFLSLIKNNVR
ncbi:MAG: GTP cyclohydrolase I [Richelia sp. RM2_1_2]|nr:GTP cyclohydrolase I [Richelia sp. RM2_1_2]